MISRKCLSSLWHFPNIHFYCWVYLVVSLNLVLHPLCQAKTETGDRRITTELTTMFPEIPQADESSQGPQIPETDPCYRFSKPNFEKHEFFSPGFPDEKTYRNNTDCVLVLEAPPGHLIKLDFRDHFSIEPSAECKNDYLEVRDGAHGYNNRLEHPFCGYEFPPLLTSSDRHLWINFKSDDTIEHQGFRAVFEYTPRPSTLKTPEITPCRIDRPHLEEGFLDKKDIPQEIINVSQQHHMPVDCIWAITVRENWKIHLQFKKFELDKPNECDKNFIEVFSMKTVMPNLIKKFCGSIADPVVSNGNVMFVRFFTDALAQKKSNFEANFTAFRSTEKNANSEEPACHEDEFDCDDATCISASLKCNGRYNCKFRWDEDDCKGSQSLSLTEDHIIIIMVIFSLILSGMCLTFIFNCVKKLIRDHHTIQEYIRQSREQQLNELDKQEPAEKKAASKQGSRSRSNSSPSSDSPRFDLSNAVNTPCYVPGGELLPILIRNEHSMSPSNGDAYHHQNIYTVDNETVPEMCDSACQTRESLFTTQGYSSGNSTPNHSIHTNSPPAPFSTFGYKKDNNKFKAEAKIEMTGGIGNNVMPNSRHASKPHGKFDADRRRPYSVQTTKSAPDVIVTH